jgi:hypothetical protein
MKITRSFIERLLNDLVKATEQGSPKDYLCQDQEFATQWNETPEFRDYFFHWAARFKEHTGRDDFSLGITKAYYSPRQTSLFVTPNNRSQLRLDFLRWLLDHGELQ